MKAEQHYDQATAGGRCAVDYAGNLGDAGTLAWAHIMGKAAGDDDTGMPGVFAAIKAPKAHLPAHQSVLREHPVR